MHPLQMKHPLHNKLLQNKKKMKPQSRVLSPLYNLQLQMMMKMKLKCLQWATKELSMRLALKRNLPVLFQPRELPRVPKPVGRMALSCQRGQKGEVRQRSPLSTLTLQDQQDRDRLGEIGLIYDSLMVQNPLCHQNQAIKVNQRKIKIRPTKSWLTNTSSSGTVEVLGVIEKT